MAKLERIAPELPAASLDSALAYYEKKLGFKVALRLPGNEYAIVERDDVAFICSSMGVEAVPVGIHIFTSDLNPLFTEFEASGATISQKIEQKPWGNRDFRVATILVTN